MDRGEIIDARRSTRDIDAVFEPKEVVYEAAASVAEQRNLPPGWLNDAVRGFLAGEDEADLRLLADKLGLESAEEVLTIAERTYGNRLDPVARFFVEQVFEPE